MIIIDSEEKLHRLLTKRYKLEKKINGGFPIRSFTYTISRNVGIPGNYLFSNRYQSIPPEESFPDDAMILGMEMSSKDLNSIFSSDVRMNFIFKDCTFCEKDGLNILYQFYIKSWIRFINCSFEAMAIRVNRVGRLEDSKSYVRFDNCNNQELSIEVEGIFDSIYINNSKFKCFEFINGINGHATEIICENSALDLIVVCGGTFQRNTLFINNNSLIFHNSIIGNFKCSSHSNITFLRWDKDGSTLKSLLSGQVKNVELFGIFLDSDLSNLDFSEMKIKIRSFVKFVGCNVKNLSISPTKDIGVVFPSIRFVDCENLSELKYDKINFHFIQGMDLREDVPALGYILKPNN